MKALKRLKYWMWIFKPSYWLMNDPYNPFWDRQLNYLLDKHEFVIVDQFNALLGNNLIWIANRPYAAMTPSGTVDSPLIGHKKMRPSRATILRAITELNKVLY